MINQNIAMQTLVRKEVTRVFRIWKQTILPPVVTSVLYFLIFGSFIGSQIQDISGVSYMQFIIPGLMMMGAITASYANVSSSFFGAKFQKSIEEILVSPMHDWMIIIAYVLGGIIRGVIIGVIVFIVSLFFTDISLSHPIITLLFLFFTSSLFGLLGLFNGFFAKSFDDVNIIPTFVITPMIYLGGVFYSLEFLSPFWQTVSHFNPIFYMVDGLRYGLLGVAEMPTYLSLGAIIAFNIIFFFINLRLMKKGYGLRS
ncbi:ABC transporter permease [Candidatus Gracilibacteria bacterium]|nr:ABC transporter permease [Candidatus Gracilibacteria bacterium]